MSIAGARLSWPRPWDLYNAENFIILCQMFVNFFSYIPYSPLALVIFAQVLLPVPCEDYYFSHKKRSRWGPLISAIIWAVSHFLGSLAALFQGTYPKISSGGAPQTFVLAVSFRVWQNQSAFEAQ